MQKLTCIYQNRVTVEQAECGWCLVKQGNQAVTESVWTDDSCLVFYPPDFVPDAAFGRKLERFIQKQAARLIWIENPADNAPLWRLTSAVAGDLSVHMGKYGIHLRQLMREADDQLVFSGSFIAGETVFALKDEQVVLCLTDTRGRISFGFTANPQNFPALDVGMKYVKILPEDAEDGWKTNYNQHISSSVILPESELVIDAAICPAAMRDSVFELPKTSWQSMFISITNDRIRMNSESARLVFEKMAEVVSKNGGTGLYQAMGLSWYLGLEGEFSVTNGSTMMLGLSGTEYIANAARLKFAAGQNALIDTGDTQDTPRETAALVTAPWLSFQGAYHCISVTMPLFVAEQNYLRPYVAKVTDFTEFSAPFPLIPWGGVWTMTDSADVSEIENTIYGNRYQILTQGLSGQAPRDEEEKVLTSPCGLCVGVQPESGCWNWVGIAQMQERGLPDVRLKMPSFAVRTALQKLDCILLASTLEEFSALSKEEIQFAFEIEGWRISFSKDTWNDNSLFLLKYSDTVTVRSLLEDTPQLSYVLDCAYDSEGNTRTGFEGLIDILDKKEFQGILLLGGSAEINELPQELRCILKWGGGGSPQAAYAVISDGKVSVDGGEISVAKSNFDALILYEDTPVFSPDGSSFAFCTRELITIIKESTVQYFQSRSELAVYEVFGSNMYADKGISDSQVILAGRLENVNGIQTYKFALESPVAYAAYNSPLTGLEIQEITVDGSEERIAFTLKGTKTYEADEELDLFSYEKIGFEGLRLVKDDTKAYIDYNSTRLLPGNAVIRENSFVEMFGAGLSEAYWQVSGLPDDKGYISINTPLSQGKLDEPWNGLVWQIPLNGSGSLGKNELLSISVLAGWNGKNYYIGVKTGGIFGQSFSLQGILTAGFTGITLEKGKEEKLLFVLHSLVLKALGFSLPQKGADVYILGDHGKAAWYAAYEGSDGNGNL